MKYIKYFFILLAIVSMGYLICGELFLPNDAPDAGYTCQELNEGWQVVKEDGTREDIMIPGSYPGKVIMERQIPADMDTSISCICFRGAGIKVYIDGELRSSYNTDDTRLFGDHSAEVYKMVFISSEDAGKTIRAELDNNANILYSVYLGDRMGIWTFLFQNYGSEIIIAFLTLILGIISIIASIALRLFYKKNIDLIYLGWGITFAAIWLISNSVFRQIMFPSVSVISDVPFLMIALMPFPFMIYMNRVQNRRYGKFYTCAGILDVIGVTLCICLHVTNTVDFNKSFLLLAICCLQSILTLAITVILDIKCRRIKEYWMVSFGLLSAFTAASYQIIAYFKRTGVFSGVPLAIGLIILLIFSVINTLKDIIQLENQKHEAMVASEAKGKFLANMSHEIRTPINAVLGMNAMILRESSESNIREYAMDIQAAGQNLLCIINDVLDISKIESGKMELVMADYDFSSVIHDIMNMVRVKSEAKDLDLNLNIDKNLPARMYGDDIRIRQVLINLLNNAVKYTEKGNVTFSISGEVKDDIALLHFSIQDTGIGIREEDLSKLFSEFERIEEKRNRNIEGTGLGMNITIQLLTLMGSKLKVESVYGEGSTFSFDLKQQITDREPIGDLEKRILEQAQNFEYRAAFTAPSANVLIVDDNAVNRKVVVNLLKETRINIDEASSGVQCLGLVGIRKYDIIFLDHMMPEMDGIETLHKIKELNQNLCINTPIIALTANAIAGAKEMYLSEGFDDFISKPIIPEKLESMLVKYLPKNKVKETIIKKQTDQGVSGIIAELEKHAEFNLEYAKMLNHKPEYMVEVFRDFYEMADAEADCMQDYYDAIIESESGDNSDTSASISGSADALRQYCIKVHSMKSSSALIGAMGLSGMALTLEKAANEGNVTVIKQISPYFLNEWKHYKEIISQCFRSEKENSVDEKDLVAEDDLVDTGDLVTEDDLVDIGDLVTEDDLVDIGDLVTENDLIAEDDLVSKEDMTAKAVKSRR